MKARIPILLFVINLVSCNSAVDRKENVTAKVNNTTIAYNQYATETQPYFSFMVGV